MHSLRIETIILNISKNIYWKKSFADKSLFFVLFSERFLWFLLLFKIFCQPTLLTISSIAAGNALKDNTTYNIKMELLKLYNFDGKQFFSFKCVFYEILNFLQHFYRPMYLILMWISMLTYAWAERIRRWDHRSCC